MSSIIIKTKDGTTMELPIYDKITVITGDSATGKTKLIKWIQSCKNVYKDNPAEIIEHTMDLNDIIIIDSKESVDNLLTSDYSYKYIFIDRFNTLNTKELTNYVINSNNVFILIGHGNIEEYASQDAVLGIKHDGKHYGFYQIYKYGLFKPMKIK